MSIKGQGHGYGSWGNLERGTPNSESSFFYAKIFLSQKFVYAIKLFYAKKKVYAKNIF